MAAADPPTHFIASNRLHFDDGVCEELRQAFDSVLRSGRFVLSSAVDAFEGDFARLIGTKHCVGVASGTDAIELALRVLGVSPGDAVLTVGNAGGYASIAAKACGATPIYAEIDTSTGLIAIDDLSRERRDVRVLVVTHLYGVPVDMHAVRTIADERGWLVIEDCAQAHGARWLGRHVGVFGDVSTFSFYPTKNLGALGDGGAIVTQSDALAKGLRALRHYGSTERYRYGLAGGRNSRLDELQAALLSVLLKGLDANNEKRRAIAKIYREQIFNPEIRFPTMSSDAFAVFHQCVALTRHRDALRSYLASRGIQTDIHYPLPDHRQPALQSGTAELPVTDMWCNEVFSLPCYPSLIEKDALYVVECCNAWRHVGTAQ